MAVKKACGAVCLALALAARAEPLADTNALVWVDGGQLPQEGRAFADTETPYYRINKFHRDRIRSANAGVSDKATWSSGICYRFTTDADELTLRWSLSLAELSDSNLSGIGKSGIDIYAWTPEKGWRFVNWRFIMPRNYPTRQKGNFYTIKWKPGQPCWIYLPLYNGITDFAVGIAKGKTVTPLPPRASGVTKPVVFYGSSITQGACASRPGIAFTALAGRLGDFPVVNLGFSGNAHMEPEVGDMLADVDASCYVLDPLGNMWTGEVNARYEAFVRKLHAARPEVPIVLAAVCWEVDRPSPRVRAAHAIYEKLKREDPREWRRLHWISEDELALDDGEYTVDGCHPNDWGMMQMGRAYAGRIRRALGLDKVRLWAGGPYWATANIGAEAPWEHGYYFWWGDTIGYKRENGAWVASDGSSTNFSFAAGNTPTYAKDHAALRSGGWITADGVLAPEHDAAHAHWGGEWRMPTRQELDDLGSKCDWTWTAINGVNGYVVRGKGDYASASIFLPASGRGRWSSLVDVGSYGCAWSSAPYSGSYGSWNLNFGSSYRNPYGNCRYGGQPVRPVQGPAGGGRGEVAAQDAWKALLEPPEGYAFKRSVKAAERYSLPDFDLEYYVQANGPGTSQRVIVAIPKGAQPPFPAVVVPFYFPEAMLGFEPKDGSPLPKFAEVAMMSDLARRGYVCISATTYHLTYVAGSTRPQGDFRRWADAGCALSRDWPGWTGMGKLAFDARLLVDMLAADPRVDKDRIGIAGHSLGGKIAIYAGAIDPRIKVILASDPGVRWDDSNWGDTWYFGEKLEEMKKAGMDNAGLLAAYGGKPLCVLAGENDGDWTAEFIGAVAPYRDHPERLEIINPRFGRHRPPKDVLEQGYGFIDRHLRK